MTHDERRAGVYDQLAQEDSTRARSDGRCEGDDLMFHLTALGAAVLLGALLAVLAWRSTHSSDSRYWRAAFNVHRRAAATTDNLPNKQRNDRFMRQGSNIRYFPRVSQGFAARCWICELSRRSSKCRPADVCAQHRTSSNLARARAQKHSAARHAAAVKSVFQARWRGL